MPRRTKAPGLKPQVESPPAEQKHSVPVIRPADSVSDLAEEIAFQSGPASNDNGRHEAPDLPEAEATHVEPVASKNAEEQATKEAPDSQPAEETGKAALPDLEDEVTKNATEDAAGSQPAEETGKAALPDLEDEVTKKATEDAPGSQPAEETGKAALPDLEEEGYDPGESDLDEDEKEPDAEPTFSETDEKDLVKLEARVNKSTRETFEALREIRKRKLFRLVMDDQGKPKYKTFDAYVENRHGHKRQWVTHGCNWLLFMETMEALGIKDPPPLTVDAAQGLYPGRLAEAGGLLAVLKEAQEIEVPLTKDNLKEIVLRRAAYFPTEGKEGIAKPAANTYGEYKQDCLVVKKLGVGADYGVIADAQKLDGDLADNIIKVSTEKKRLPRTEKLLFVFTGKPLEEIVTRLGTLGQEQADIEAKKNLLATRRKQIRAIQQEGSLVKLKEEAKALQAELEQKGVITKRNGSKAKKDDPGDDGGDQDADEEGAEEETNDVQDNIDTALTHLDAAFDSDWPEPEKGGMIAAILQSSQKCETKLAEITAKAKELLADADLEPEVIPNGDQ